MAAPQPYEPPSVPRRCFLMLFLCSASNAVGHYFARIAGFREFILFEVRIDFLGLGLMGQYTSQNKVQPEKGVAVLKCRFHYSDMVMLIPYRRDDCQ